MMVFFVLVLFVLFMFLMLFVNRMFFNSLGLMVRFSDIHRRMFFFLQGYNWTLSSQRCSGSIFLLFYSIDGGLFHLGCAFRCRLMD